jgi:hypothetical protein
VGKGREKEVFEVDLGSEIWRGERKRGEEGGEERIGRFHAF